MYREKIKELEQWKKNKNRKPLIIRGARQVGKTWLMKEFGKNYYEKYAYINLESNNKIILDLLKEIKYSIIYSVRR